jgi:hypothetical protein
MNASIVVFSVKCQPKKIKVQSNTPSVLQALLPNSLVTCVQVYTFHCMNTIHIYCENSITPNNGKNWRPKIYTVMTVCYGLEEKSTLWFNRFFHFIHINKNKKSLVFSTRCIAHQFYFDFISSFGPS